MMTEKRCEECGGYARTYRMVNSTTMSREDCPACDGTGTVTDDVAAAISAIQAAGCWNVVTEYDASDGSWRAACNFGDEEDPSIEAGYVYENEDPPGNRLGALTCLRVLLEQEHGIDTWGTGTEEPLRCECEACYWDGQAKRWVWRWDELEGMALHDEDEAVAHCPGDCGCRLSVQDGKPRVGPSRRKLMNALKAAIDWMTAESWLTCPADLDCCVAERAGEAVFDANAECRRVLAGYGEACWLREWGVADNDEQARALWAEMGRDDDGG